jgi:RNA polymerase sigma-70 factor (ECF subfamily)
VFGDAQTVSEELTGLKPFGNMTDAELIAEIRQGRSASAFRPGASASAYSERSRQALGELLNRHYAWLARLCLMEIREQTAALDCLQEIMLEIAKSISRFDGRSALRTWMFVIAKRVSARYRSKERQLQDRFPLGKEDDVSMNDAGMRTEGDDAEEQLLLSERNRRLLGLSRMLPEKQRYAVFFHYFEDLSVEETAERIGCSAGTVKVHLFRARESLRRFFDDEAEKVQREGRS